MKAYKKHLDLLVIAVAALMIMAAAFLVAHPAYAEGEQTYKITVNTTSHEAFAEKFGTEFKRYSGTEFNEKFGDEIWYYDMGHGKVFINVDPNNYNGGNFYEWESYNDSESVYSTYGSAVNIATGEPLWSIFLEDTDDGYSVYYVYGEMTNIDIIASVEATLAYADVTLEKQSFVYTGKRIKPAAEVKLDGVTLTEAVDYILKYENNLYVNNGDEDPVVIVTDYGDYNNKHFNPELNAYVIYEKEVPFRITKATHPGITAKAKTASVKYSKVRSKAQTVKMTQVVAVTGRKGSLSYSISPIGTKAKKALKYKNGKISIKKGTKKGIYKFKVTVKDSGGRNYKASAKRTITTKIRVN